MKKGIFISSFLLGHVFVLAICSAISIYYFDYYEKGYGKSISFQLSLWIILLGTFFAGFGFGIGLVISNWVAKYWVGLALGALFATLMMGLAGIGELFGIETSMRQILIFGFWLFGSILIPVISSKIINSKND